MVLDESQKSPTSVAIHKINRSGMALNEKRPILMTAPDTPGFPSDTNGICYAIDPLPTSPMNAVHCAPPGRPCFECFYDVRTTVALAVPENPKHSLGCIMMHKLVVGTSTKKSGTAVDLPAERPLIVTVIKEAPFRFRGAMTSKQFEGKRPSTHIAKVLLVFVSRCS